MRITALMLGLLLLASACTTPEVETATRLANLEQRMAQLEADRDVTGAAPDAPAPVEADGEQPELEEPEKAAFAAAALDDSLKERLALDSEVAIRFVEATNTLVVRAESGSQPDLDAAWSAAQELAELWGGLEVYQPVLDLAIGDVRCACSAKLMKDVKDEVADRDVWEQACGLT